MCHALQYNQVPRILNPVVHTLDSLPELYKDQHAKVHIDSIYGSLDNARYVASARGLTADRCQVFEMWAVNQCIMIADTLQENHPGGLPAAWI